MSSAELSLDITYVVKRLLAGEPVDVERTGEDLAGKYPDLGMPGELIAKAVARTASMMGVVLEGWSSPPPTPPLDALSKPDTEEAVSVLHDNAAEDFASDISDVMDTPLAAGTVTGRDPVDGVRTVLSIP